MFLLLASLSMLFAATLVGYAVVRLGAAEWPPPGSPPLPGSLALSTAVLLVSSVTMARAVRALEGGRATAVRRHLAATLALGLVFVALQGVSWSALTEARPADVTTLFQFTFLMLCGLHALHVLGGLVALGLVTSGAWRGRASPAAIRHTATYWHYLDAVWLLIFAVLVLG